MVQGAWWAHVITSAIKYLDARQILEGATLITEPWTMHDGPYTYFRGSIAVPSETGRALLAIQTLR